MKSTQRIALLLALVFLLPALFFSVYEFSSLDDDEKMIEQIYSKQLEAILFSVNQYSDDIVSRWTTRVADGLEEKTWNNAPPAKIHDLLNLNASILAVSVIDSAEWKPQSSWYSVEPSDGLRAVTEAAIGNARELINQMIGYRRSGFQKLESLSVPSDSVNARALIFILPAEKRFIIAAIVIDPELFVEDIVGPRLQTIAADQFILSVIHKTNNAAIYSTLANGEVVNSSPAEALTKDLWILPDYALGIRTSQNSLKQIVRERTRINLMLLGGLDIILIVAVVLVYRNLKKEVDLAQNKADFVSNVSHEIRTPLALISMFAETLEMNRVPTEDKKQEYYRILSKESQRLTGIVNKILNFSQTEAKKKNFHIEALKLNAEIKSILNTYDFHLKNKGFEYALKAGDEVVVHADREALIESVINLIDNAVKYSEDVKRIEIFTGRQNGWGFVSVKDSGVGISSKDQKHIFDKFYRVPKGNLARTRGTGLGLSLVKQLMESQKGDIQVESSPGAGSTFTLYFPLA